MDRDKIMGLKLAIDSEQKVLDELNVKKAEFDAANRELIERLAQHREQVSSLKEELKLEAEAEFNTTGLKKLLGGVGIRVGSSLGYEPDKALSWAKEHQLCLKLDVKEFEAIAKTQDLDFVTKEDKVTVTFPKEIKLEDGN